MKYPVVVLCFVLFCNSSFAVEINRSNCLKAFKAGDYQQSLEQCSGAAESGDLDAAFIVARLYAQGVLGQPDLPRSVKWLKLAAQLGHGEAAYNLGVAFQYGRGAQRDLAKAIEAYQQAADANNPKALRNLAVLSETGNGVEQDLASAFLLYQRAAVLGQTDSQLKAAVMLLRGTGTDADPKQARAWMKKAAESGNADAQVTLAVLLADTDFPASYYWYKKAAKQNNPYALHNLAILYYNGTKVEKNLLKALAYAEKSIALGNENSQMLYDAVLAKIQSSGQTVKPSVGTELDDDLDASAAGFKDAAWLAAQPANRYVVQLAQLDSKKALDRYLDRNQLQGKVNYLYGNTNAGRVYVVLYATDFSGYRVAQEGGQGVLSAAVIKKAWIRSYGSLQQDYTEVGEH